MAATPARSVGAKGRAAPGQAAPPGPEVSSKYWVEVCDGSAASQGTKVVVDRVGAALGRVREQRAFGAEEVQVEVRERGLRQVLEGDDDLAGGRVER